MQRFPCCFPLYRSYTGVIIGLLLAQCGNELNRVILNLMNIVEERRESSLGCAWHLLFLVFTSFGSLFALDRFSAA